MLYKLHPDTKQIFGFMTQLSETGLNSRPLAQRQVHPLLLPVMLLYV